MVNYFSSALRGHAALPVLNEQQSRGPQKTVTNADTVKGSSEINNN